MKVYLGYITLTLNWDTPWMNSLKSTSPLPSASNMSITRCTNGFCCNSGKDINSSMLRAPLLSRSNFRNLFPNLLISSTSTRASTIVYERIIGTTSSRDLCQESNYERVDSQQHATQIPLHTCSSKRYRHNTARQEVRLLRDTQSEIRGSDWGDLQFEQSSRGIELSLPCKIDRLFQTDPLDTHSDARGYLNKNRSLAKDYFRMRGRGRETGRTAVTRSREDRRGLGCPCRTRWRLPFLTSFV